jgi:hypothetical protein
LELVVHGAILILRVVGELKPELGGEGKKRGADKKSGQTPHY